MMWIKEEIRVLAEHWRICSYLSVQDVKSRFRRSRLGVLWLVINQLAFSVGGGIIWARIFNDSPGRLIPFLTISFAVWGFMTAAVGEGCGAFVIAHSYLKQLPLPQGLFIFRTLLTQLIYLAVGIATAVAVGVITRALPYEGLAKAVPGLLLLIAYAYGAIGTMAYLGVRYRDLAHGFAGLFSLLFVISPVIYPAEMLIKRGLPIAVYGNPFASLLEVIRGPLLSGRFADGLHYAVAGAFAGALILARIYLGRSWTSQVPMWL